MTRTATQKRAERAVDQIFAYLADRPELAFRFAWSELGDNVKAKIRLACVNRILDEFTDGER